jgi:hypothetical protein
VIDNLLREEQEILDTTDDLGRALDALIAGQIEFVVGDRHLAQVYYNEIKHLSEEDRRRLRRKQRLYLEEWAHLVSELRADLSGIDARSVVRARFSASAADRCGKTAAAAQTSTTANHMPINVAGAMSDVVVQPHPLP